MTHGRKISVTGLGYVGLPVAIAFGLKGRVIGFDISESRIAGLKKGVDKTGEVSKSLLASADVVFTSDPEDLRQADFHIVAVPTPINAEKLPDLTPLLSASEILAPRLTPGDVVVYESTVYPGATEEECVPLLEQGSGLRCGRDFSVGYSPERINPGDATHRFTDITKVVSGLDAATLEIVANVYSSVVEAGIFRASSIRVAEAAKVIENTQRDLNIALMNELSLICEKLDIDTGDVLAAAGTKWNFLPFRPGLVGGHCIGVDPYYLTYKARALGYNPEVILAGRRINDSIGDHVALKVLDYLSGRNAGKVTVLGFTFKENVPDTRNTRIIDIVRKLMDDGIDVQIHDPVADQDDVSSEYGMELVAFDKLLPADCVILAVAHREFAEYNWDKIKSLLIDGSGMVFDIKGMLDRDRKPEEIQLTRL